MRPLIGISCCQKPFGIFGTPNHAASDSYIRVVRGPARGTPVLLPAAGEDLSGELLPHLDGLILTGSRSNVWPGHYDGPAHADGTPEDHHRDATTLPLIRAAIDRGVPLLAICRGIQELNVALGGTLFAEVQEIEGRLDHRAPVSDNQDERFAIRQSVSIKEGSCLAGIFGAGTVPVNSVHRQAVDRVGARLVVEAVAEDGTVEAVSVKDAKAFAVGVQWHPEYWAKTDDASARIFRAFGDAARAHRTVRLNLRPAAE